MSTGKTSTLTFRIEPSLKEALIRDYCGRKGIAIQEPQALALEGERKPQPPER